MSPFSHIRFAGKSDVGRRRKNNEDSFGVFPACGVFCVADGMGGGDDGEIASAATVNAVRDFCYGHPLPPGKCWKRTAWLDGVCGSVIAASGWIHDRAKKKGQKGCGSTFVGLCLDPSRPKIAMSLHAGDSRLYLWHRGWRGSVKIRQITRDHSFGEGRSDGQPSLRGAISRAVGVLPTVEIERTRFRVSPGDRVLLCSDGITKMLSDGRLADILAQYDQAADAVNALVAEANAAGGVDNATAVVVDVDSIPKPLPATDLLEVTPLALEEEAETGEEPVTSDSKCEDVELANGGDADNENPPATVTNCAVREDAGRRVRGVRWPLVAIALGGLVVAAIICVAVCSLSRRAATMKNEASVREERMRQTVEKVRRQSEKRQQLRMESERILREADDLAAQERRNEDLNQIQRNVELPHE